jgi:hypothetical protein
MLRQAQHGFHFDTLSTERPDNGQLAAGNLKGHQEKDVNKRRWIKKKDGTPFAAGAPP